MRFLHFFLIRLVYFFVKLRYFKTLFSNYGRFTCEVEMMLKTTMKDKKMRGSNRVRRKTIALGSFEILKARPSTHHVFFYDA